MKKFWTRNKAKIRFFDFALVGREKFEAKRSEMKRKFVLFFSRERSKRMQNGSRFASFRFEAKNFLKRNRCTLVQSTVHGLFKMHFLEEYCQYIQYIAHIELEAKNI
jgi:hypothetical protein